MNIVDAMLGHRRLTELGFSPDVIRKVLSKQEFGTEQEMLNALRVAQKKQDRSSAVSGPDELSHEQALADHQHDCAADPAPEGDKT